jgi:group I intron endonuclease
MYGKVPASAFQSGANNPMFGKSHSDETRAKISELPAQTGANNPMYGRTGTLNPMFGKSHSDETRAKISELPAKTGANNPMYGRTGANHPMYGKVAANAMTINVYSIDNVLVRSFTSQVAAAEWLSVNQSTVSKYIKSGGKQK